MDCEWRSKVDPYVDAELPDPESAQMQAHVLTCASCAAEALGRLQMQHAVRAAAAARFAPSPDFRRKVEASVSDRKTTRHWFSMPQMALAGAAAAVVLLAIGFWLYRAQSADVNGELADLHVATLASANPVDVVSTDRHTVKPWFAGKLPFTFNLPDLENTSYRLVGGRVSYLEQAPGAQLLFAVRKHQVSVFIFQDRNGLKRLSSSLTDKQRLQFTVETWAAGGLRYFVIGDVTRDDIDSLVALLKTAASS